MFSTRDDEFIVEPLWNETQTPVDDDDDDAGFYHVVYRRSDVNAAAAANGIRHCGLRGLSIGLALGVLHFIHRRL